MFEIRIPSQYYLRSNQQDIWKVPPSKCATLGDRSFAVDGPRRWNALPIELRTCTNFNSFKRQFKTHLFVQAFYLICKGPLQVSKHTKISTI